MNPTETFPHRRAPELSGACSLCRCGASSGDYRPSWGRDCSAALREALAKVEGERATPGPHIPPALLRRVEALGFVPGSGEPVDWLIRDHLRLRQALNDAEAAHGVTIAERDAARRDLFRVIAERDAQVRLTDDLGARVAELEATLANERGEGEPPVPGWLSVRVYGNGKFSPGWRREDIVVVRLDVEFPWRVFLVDGTMFSPVHDADGRLASAPTARAAMIGADAARAAGGGAS